MVERRQQSHAESRKPRVATAEPPSDRSACWEKGRALAKKPGFTRAEPDLVTDIHEGKRSVLFLLEYSLYRRAKEQTICPFDREHAHE
jgi:hypothetical protein